MSVSVSVSEATAAPIAPGAARVPARPPVLTLDAPATQRLLRRLATAGAGVAPGPVVVWGTVSGYRHLLGTAPPLVLLDLVRPADARAVDRLVRSCGLLAPVAVLAAPGADPVVPLEAGAVDVLDREAPAPELAARLRADLRRSGPAGCAVYRAGRVPAGSGAQFLLLDLLTRAHGPVCCHELRWLLGRPDRPLPLPALKMRIHRLRPLLCGSRLALEDTTEYGLVTYRLAPVRDTRSHQS